NHAEQAVHPAKTVRGEIVANSRRKSVDAVLEEIHVLGSPGKAKDMGCPSGFYGGNGVGNIDKSTRAARIRYAGPGYGNAEIFRECNRIVRPQSGGTCDDAVDVSLREAGAGEGRFRGHHHVGLLGSLRGLVIDR